MKAVMKVIDLRSDVVAHSTSEMQKAMSRAKIGDDAVARLEAVYSKPGRQA
jgi:threonine aldolase